MQFTFKKQFIQAKIKEIGLMPLGIFTDFKA
jgi:hypothetical protein